MGCNEAPCPSGGKPTRTGSLEGGAESRRGSGGGTDLRWDVSEASVDSKSGIGGCIASRPRSNDRASLVPGPSLALPEYGASPTHPPRRSRTVRRPTLRGPAHRMRNNGERAGRRPGRGATINPMTCRPYHCACSQQMAADGKSLSRWISVIPKRRTLCMTRSRCHRSVRNGGPYV